MSTIYIPYKILLFPSLLYIPVIIQIDELEPVFVPEPVSFTFNTPAWYVLGFVMLLLTIYIIFLQLKKYKKNRYRRDAIKQLNSWNVTNTNNDANKVLNNIRILLKQLAIYRYGRLQVASLYGSDWLKFLESKGKDTPFSKYSILVKSDLKLNSDIENQNIDELLEISKNWIKTHA